MLSFLLILALITGGLHKDALSMHKISSVFAKREQLARELTKTMVQRRFSQMKVNGPSEKRATTSQNEETQSYTSKRLRTPPHALSKWNLRPFLTTPDNPYLYKVTATLVRSLYPDLLDESLLEPLLHALVAKQEGAKTLADLTPDDPELASLYYKMLRGTNTYDVESKEGIPPLEDFICLREEKAAAHFRHASLPVLEAILGKEMKNKILSEETKLSQRKKKAMTLTKQQFATLEGFSDCLEHLFLFSFSAFSKKKTEIGKEDPGLRLTVRKRI